MKKLFVAFLLTAILLLPVSFIPSAFAITIEDAYQQTFDYGARTDGQPVYVCNGARGLATSAQGWIIYKYTYDGSNNVTVRQAALDSCDNRATATYS